MITAALRDEGIEVLTGTKAVAVEREGGQRVVVAEDGRRLGGDQILVAVGRRPATGALGLDAAGVQTDPRGAVTVDRHLRTTARNVWAAGDVAGGLQFTHVAEHMAKTVLRNSILPFKSKISYDSVPRVTFTDPEVAHVGLSEEEAVQAGGQTYRYELSDLDRAIADGTTRGFAKIMANGKGRILGATIVAHGAGELLMPLVLAKTNGIGLSRVAGTIFPYPTMVEAVKRTSNEYMRGRLDTTAGRAFKRIVGWLK